MFIDRPWAFFRRVEYGAGFLTVLALCSVGAYYLFFYAPANCFDGNHNGDEHGIDCSGACNRICAFEVMQPSIRWAHAFRVSEGMYNAVAYIENKNTFARAEEVAYTFRLFDKDNRLLTEKSGQTYLPPDSTYPIFEGRLFVQGIPAKTLVELKPVSHFEKSESGRETFVVQSRTLKNVDDDPRLEATIYNTTLEDGHDVDAVATIFDSRGTPLTSSRTVIPLFEARSEKRVTFTWPEPIAKTIRSCEVSSDVLLSIDLSGSMNDDGGTPPEPVTSTLKAAAGFVGRLRGGDQIGVATFATDAGLATPLSSDHKGQQSKVLKLTIDPASERGGTNIGDGIIEAAKELSSPRHNADARKVLVLLTDGKANEPEEKTAEAYALGAAAKAKAAGIEIFTIGLGGNVNKAFLATIASKPSYAYLASNTKVLDQIYTTISSSLCEEGAAVIDIVPKASYFTAP